MKNDHLNNLACTKFEQKVITGADGSRAKFISNKDTGKTVWYFKKDANGNVKKVAIDESLFGLAKVTAVETPKAYFVKETVPSITSSTIRIPKNPNCN